MTKLLITCVAENNPEFHFRVITLFKTLKEFGGNLANAKLLANFVNNIDRKISNQLKSMGVSVRIVKPYHKKLQRHCNKIRMLEIDEDYDVLIALDCDTAITRDFSSEISTNSIRRCDSLLDPLEIHEWEYLYKYFNLTMPLNENEIHANSAVLFIPKKYVKDLKDIWLYYSYLVNDSFFSNDYWKKFGQYKYYTDQFALSLALANQNIKVNLLPAEFNIHINGSYSSWADQLHPYILSYHHNITDDWKLKTTGMSVPDKYIKEVNNIL
ncbi:hypothetical protein AT960_11195 [Priestia megaterium]|uniref:hypothetical protein n=1 Tax=Priestia megaterium TaxID=1404 RepID=UPI0007C56B53|nr:hypothetical protein [Priestia megaterium]MCI4621431.1 hypothetical protein [Priestia megaterium]OAD47923.1 hypothetical protein AT960_11195 [Priestia megaterium]